jgi:hypothetical protein
VQENGFGTILNVLVVDLLRSENLVMQLAEIHRMECRQQFAGKVN